MAVRDMSAPNLFVFKFKEIDQYLVEMWDRDHKMSMNRKLVNTNKSFIFFRKLFFKNHIQYIEIYVL